MKQQNRYLPPIFWQISIAFYAIALCSYFYWGDKTILFFFNANNNNFLDILNVVFSFFGRGEVIAIALILLLTLPKYRTKTHILYASIYGITTILVSRQLKLFFKVDRPLLVFPNNQLHTVAWTKQAYIYSFPSGHTLGIFSLACFVLLAFNITNKTTQIWLAILCICVGLSRIYLAQHFISDVLFGAALGIFIGTLIGYLAQQSLIKNKIKS